MRILHFCEQHPPSFKLANSTKNLFGSRFLGRLKSNPVERDKGTNHEASMSDENDLVLMHVPSRDSELNLG